MVVCRYWVLFVVFILLAGVSANAGDVIELDGILEPSDMVEVSSQTPGIIDEVVVERGDKVKRGDVVARLKSGVEKAAVALARARVEFGKRKMVRNEELYRKQLISVHEKDELETEVRISELQEQEAMERLKLRTITSPVDGIVVERTGSPGEYIGEGSFMTVAQIDPINVEVIAPIAYLKYIKKGMKADVIPESPAGSIYQARVVIVDHVVDAASGTFGVRLELPNALYKIFAGLKCKVRFAQIKGN